MAEGGTIWLPVAPSFRGFGAAIIKEATGAARGASNRLESDLGQAGRNAGQAAGQGMADGLQAAAQKVEKATSTVVQARKREADASANVTLAEARLSEARSNNGSAAAIAKQEAALESARRKQESASRLLAGSESDLDAVRRGEPARAAAIVRTTAQVEAARVKMADSNDKVRLAEQRMADVQADSSATASQVARAQADLTRARSESTSATDQLRAKEALHEATLADVERQARQTADGVEEAGRSADEAGGFMSTAADKAKALALGLGAAAGAAFAMGADVAGQISTMNDQLGLTGVAAQQLGGEVGQVLRSGVAADAETAAGAVGALTSQFGYLGFEGEKTAAELSRNFIGFTETFGMEMADATQTVGQLIGNGFAKDATEGIDLLTTSFQRVPAAMREGLPDILNEYGVNFKGLGFSGEQAFGLLVSAAEKGEIVLDKTGDALKEFQIRGSDMSTSTSGAFDAIGLSAEDMAKKIAEGGPGAQDALQQTAQGLLAMEDPAERANTAIALFGSPLEDLSIDQIPQFMEALTGADSAMSGSAGSSEALAQSIENSLGGRINAAKGVILDLAGQGFMVLWDTIQNKIVPAFQIVGDWIQRNQTWLAPLAVAIGAAAVAWGVWTGAILVWTGVTTTASGVMTAFNAVMGMNPILKVIMVVAALVAGLIYFFTQTQLGQQIWSTFMGYLTTAWEAVKGAFASAWAVIQPILNGIWMAIKVVGAVVATVILTVIMVYWKILSAYLTFVWNVIIKPVFEAIKFGLSALGAFFGWVWNSLIKPAWDALGAGIAWVVSTLIEPAWARLKSGLETVGAFFQRIWNSIIKPAWEALGSGIRTVIDSTITPAWNRMKDGLGAVGSFFSTVVDGIRTVWDAMKGHVARPINFVIDTVWNNGLVKSWNTIAEFLPGLPKASPLSPVAFAEGGPVPLTQGAKRGKDSVHALMMPNEHVLDVNNVRNAGGHGQVYRMRSMIDSNQPFTWVNGQVVPAGHGLEPQRFADGGEVKGAGSLSPSPGESGLQPIAILAKRLIHRIWPDITSIGGYRQDAYPEHPSGRALDVMVGVGNPAGDEVTSWALANDKILPLIHALWKQTVWMPNGSTQPMDDRGSPTQNHMDHPHLWYQQKQVDPNVVPEGLVGHDGLNREDRLGIVKTKISEILDNALNPIREGVERVVGTPPPEMLGIPPIAIDRTKEAAVDGAFSFAEGIAGDLKEVYNKAKDVVSSVTGMFSGGINRDTGGILPQGKSIVNNETGKPEQILNWDQIGKIERIINGVQDMSHRQDILTQFGILISTGDYRGRIHGLTGIEEDDDLIHLILSVREGFVEMQKGFDKTLNDAGLKAISSYGSEALDFLGFKGLADGVQGVWDAFDPNKATAAATTATSGGAVDAAAFAGPTSAGGGVTTHGDPNAVYQTSEKALKTEMPDLDRANVAGEGAERWRSMMIDALKNQGMDDWANDASIVDRFIKQIDTESKGDPGIAQQIVDVNGTGEAAGVGLGQAIPGTWAAYRDPNLPDDRRNGWSMLNFMARYVRQKYGEQGYTRIGNGIGYDHGGIAQGIGLMPKHVLSPERVLSPRQTVAFEDWLNAGTSDGMLNVLHGIPTAQDLEAMATRLSHESEGSMPFGSTGPLVHIEKLEARDEAEAMRAAHREARRVARSSAFSGGWG